MTVICRASILSLILIHTYQGATPFCGLLNTLSPVLSS